MNLLTGLVSKAAGAAVVAAAFTMSPAFAQHGGGHAGGGMGGMSHMGGMGGMSHIGGGMGGMSHMGGGMGGVSHMGGGPGYGGGVHHLGGGYGGYGGGLYGGYGGLGGLGLLGFGPFGYGLGGYGPLGYGMGGYGPYGYGGYGLGSGLGYGSPYLGGLYSDPARTYSRGYSSAPITGAASAPYLTGQTYEPGDGYRYPLYYDPVNQRYIYYPVGR